MHNFLSAEELRWQSERNTSPNVEDEVSQQLRLKCGIHSPLRRVQYSLRVCGYLVITMIASRNETRGQCSQQTVVFRLERPGRSAHLLSMLLYICYYIYVAAPAHGEVHALDLVGPVSSFPRQSTYTLTLNLSGGSGITDMSAFKLRRASRRAVIVYATNSKLA